MTHIAKSDKDYERRQIVARIGKAGEFRVGKKLYAIPRYMTFWVGPNRPSLAAEFVRKADTDTDGFIHLDRMREGEILVTPGLVYRKIPMTGAIMAAHMNSMKFFRPRDITIMTKDTEAGPVDVGTIDLRTKH